MQCNEKETSKTDASHVMTSKDDTKKMEQHGLPEKECEARESLLTELMKKDKHIRGIYHCFAAAIFGVVVNSMVFAYFRNGDLNLGLRILKTGFQKFDVATCIWIALITTTCIGFVCFNIWAWIRCHLHPKSSALRLWDRLWLGLLVLNYIFHFYLAIKLVRFLDVGAVCTLVLLIETSRLLMKLHAFIRTSAPAVLNYKPHSEQVLPLKKFSNFFYFLFAPVLIYRDEYPRTKNIRWSFVAKCVLEIVFQVIFVVYLVDQYFVRNLKDFGIKPYTMEEVVHVVLGSCFTGSLLMLLAFYIVLHSWQNAFAEVLTFADRKFYADWWTSTTYARFLRTWNVLVYNWLYTYIYKDMYEHILPKNKAAAKAAVFFTSGAIHELILTVSLRTFFPLLFSIYCSFGLLFSYIKTSNSFIWHTLFLYSYFFGWSLQFCLYAVEFFARTNNPVRNHTMINYIIPRTFTCKDCIR